MLFYSTIILGLHPICVPAGWPVSVSYLPLSVGIFGMVLVLLYCKIRRELLNINLAGTYFFLNGGGLGPSKRGPKPHDEGEKDSRQIYIKELPPNLTVK